MEEVVFNKCQSSLEELELHKYPQEVQEQFWDYLNNVPLIRWLVSPTRPLISELPRDEEGKAIIDITKPPILEDSDYFRQAAINWQETGNYTHLKPNINPNSDFGKWLLEEYRRGWEGLVNPDTGMWITGDYYWMLNYCPMHMVVKRKDGLEMRSTRHPKFWDGQFLVSHYILQARQHKHHGAYLASRGKGKAHPYSQLVYTPDGMKSWGDIQIGDTLFGDDGLTTTVTQIPFDAEEDIYTVTLSDGRSLQCTSGHLFYVKDHRKHQSMIVTSLYEIMHSDYAHKRKDGGTEYYYAIPNNKKVEFKAQDVAIDPYTLGLLIGDGCFTKSSLHVAEFTSNEEDIKIYKSLIPYEIYERKAKYSHGVKISNLKNCLENYGLWNTTSSTKFIPKEYLFNTSEVRMALLQGIMDTDGTVNNNGVPMLTTTSERLAEDIRWLCHSLGYNSTMFIKQGKYKDIKGVHTCKITYNVTILTNDPIFKLQRKLEKLTDFPTAYSRSRKDWTRIVNIQYSHREKAKCVIVNNQSHCYLIGDFIVTHNTSLGASMLARRFEIGESLDNRKEVQCMVTASDRTKLIGTNQILDVFLDYIDFCAKNTQFDSLRSKSSAQELYWEMGYKKSGSNVVFGSKNSVSGIISGVNQDKLNGSRGVLYLIEEAGIFKNLVDMYNMIRPSVEQGSSVFGEILAYGCVCAGTKVLDENGILRNIEDIQLGDKLLGYNGNGVSTEDITYIQDEAYKECVRITTSNGGMLECSIDHPLLTVIKEKGRSYTKCGFYKAEELKPGMSLLMPKKIDRFGNIHEDNAFLLGALFGDGNYSNHSCVSLSICTEEEYNYYNSKYDIGISKLSKGINTYAQIYFRKLHPLLQKYHMDKQSFENKKLPYNIDLWDKESICEFLSGYFNADGNIQIHCGKHRAIKLTCSYKNILEQVKHLLHKIGINARILAENKPYRVLHSNVNNCDYQMTACVNYVLYVNTSQDVLTFRENLHFLIKVKQERLDSYISPQRPERDYKSLDFVFRENQKGKYFIGKQIKDLKGVTIKKVERIGKQRIYNLTANTTHTYITNGFISSNTAGNDQSDFTAFAEMIYSPDGYNLEGMDNVFDKEGQGRKKITMFYPVYLNYDDSCIDENGNSNVTKALLKVLDDRYKVKYGSSDINTITKRISQYPITPQEAIIRSQGNVFPVTELNERLTQIDNDPAFYDGIYVGELVVDDGSSENAGKYVSNGIKFNPTVDLPIRDFPTKDNKVRGAIEIYEMPQKGPDGKVPTGRYIAGTDPYDSDTSNTMSFGSFLLLDLWTDRIVAEYTGRPMFADQFYENTRLLCLFYNAKNMYEQNLKGLFSYYSTRNSTYLLAETPEYLREKQLVTQIGYGNKAMGIHATVPIIKYGFRLIRDWLLKPVTKIEKNTDGEEVEVTVPNLYNLKNRAFIKELIQWNPNGNYDRCVLGETQIQTICGIKNIQDISLGDEILTISGEYNKVCQLHKNKFDGKMIQFRAMGDYRYLNCTYNHPIAYRTKVGPGGRSWMKTKHNMTLPAYKEAQYINKDDYVLIPKRINLPPCWLPDDKLYLLGWYISDGNISTGNYVRFLLQENQYEIALKLRDLLNKYWESDDRFIEEYIRTHKGKEIVVPAHTLFRHTEARIHKGSQKYNGKSVKMWVVEIASKEAKEFFAQYGGTPNHKDIADSIYNTTGLLPLIRGLFEGDGHYRCEVRCDGALRNSLELSTVYEKLIHKVRQILLDEGIWSTVRRIPIKGLMSKEQYNINIVNKHVIPIIEGSLKFPQILPVKKIEREHYLEDDLGFWVKARDITSYHYVGDVYNIGVENDHNYCANGIATHNCMAAVQLLLYREEKMMLYQGDMKRGSQVTLEIEKDDYWVKNYHGEWDGK